MLTAGRFKENNWHQRWWSLYHPELVEIGIFRQVLGAHTSSGPDLMLYMESEDHDKLGDPPASLDFLEHAFRKIEDGARPRKLRPRRETKSTTADAGGDKAKKRKRTADAGTKRNARVPKRYSRKDKRARTSG